MKNRPLARDVAQFIVRLLLGGTLIWTGLIKINRPYDFLGVVYSYQLVGPRFGFIVAMLLPWLELVVGITLLAGLLINGSLLLASAMGLLFIYVEASALHRSLPISCGCFSISPGSGIINYATLTWAGIFFILAVVGIFCGGSAGNDRGFVQR